MRKNRFLLFILAVTILMPLCTYLSAYYTEWLFFKETGFSPLFFTKLYAQTVTGLFSGVFLFAFLLANLLYANTGRFSNAGSYIETGNIRLRREYVLPLIKPLGVLLVTGISLFAGRAGAMQWEKVLVYMNRVPVGKNDPLLGNDLGFYLFNLPLLEVVKNYLNFAIVATLLITLLTYYLRGGIALTFSGITG